MIHNFHIPVLGLSFSIDTPVKVARYGISSAISLSSDALIEDMRAHYSREFQQEYLPIAEKDEDYRARRITAYLNLLNTIVNQQFTDLKKQAIDKQSELTSYLDLVPEDSQVGHWYKAYNQCSDEGVRHVLEKFIRNALQAGSIDVNIMTKVDKTNYDSDGEALPSEYSDALSALRGYANSEVRSSVVFSAGFNPRLYSYLEEFDCFYPNRIGELPKKVVLKVSDYRSAIVQGRFLAKKGIWVSEFRIESGLNCGGHAFPTEGLLLGPILLEFKLNRSKLISELFDMCKQSWDKRGISFGNLPPSLSITVQGGIGTYGEHSFLTQHYDVQSTGWGTPFLLVPEATTVDEPTLRKLMAAKSEDLYLSKTSPLGVPFNNIRNSFSESERTNKIAKNRPGSPCLKKYLVSNTEFTEEPICTASRQFQYLKIKELEAQNLNSEDYEKAYENIVVKACLCEDLAAPAYTNYGIKAKVKPSTAICPGPNLAYFTSQYSLKEMVKHIYGQHNLLKPSSRPHMFINELKMYIEFLSNEWNETGDILNKKREKYLHTFKANLEKGISYYESLIPEINMSTFKEDLRALACKLGGLEIITQTL